MKYHFLLFVFVLVSSCGYDKKPGLDDGEVQVYQTNSLLDLRYHLNQKGIDGLVVSNISTQERIWDTEFFWGEGTNTPLRKAQDLTSQENQENFKSMILDEIDSIEKGKSNYSFSNDTFQVFKDDVTYLLQNGSIRSYTVLRNGLSQILVIKDDEIAISLEYESLSLNIKSVKEKHWFLSFNDGVKVYQLEIID